MEVLLGIIILLLLFIVVLICPEMMTLGFMLLLICCAAPFMAIFLPSYGLYCGYKKLKGKFSNGTKIQNQTT